jgi:hypothetical protein
VAAFHARVTESGFTEGRTLPWSHVGLPALTAISSISMSTVFATSCGDASAVAAKLRPFCASPQIRGVIDDHTRECPGHI